MIDSQAEVHPLKGIQDFGPYSQAIANYVPNSIRLAIVCPTSGLQRVSKLVHELQLEHNPRERKNYLIPFNGFTPMFGCSFVMPAKDSNELALIPDDDFASALKRSDPHAAVSELVLGSLRKLASISTRFDIVLVYLPQTLSDAFEKKDEHSEYDLHDSIKAVSSGLQIPVQVLNDGALNYRCRCSVAWRLSLALYAKAGGIPWKIATTNSRHAYVGLGYCLRKTKKRTLSLVAVKFLMAKANLQFLLYESSDGVYDGDNPYLPRQKCEE